MWLLGVGPAPRPSLSAHQYKQPALRVLRAGIQMAEFRCNPSLTCVSANSNEKSLCLAAERKRARVKELDKYETLKHNEITSYTCWISPSCSIKSNLYPIFFSVCRFVVFLNKRIVK